MEMMPVKPERKAQLDRYAQRHGQDLITFIARIGSLVDTDFERAGQSLGRRILGAGETFR